MTIVITHLIPFMGMYHSKLFGKWWSSYTTIAMHATNFNLFRWQTLCNNMGTLAYPPLSFYRTSSMLLSLFLFLPVVSFWKNIAGTLTHHIALLTLFSTSALLIKNTFKKNIVAGFLVCHSNTPVVQFQTLFLLFNIHTQIHQSILLGEHTW